MLGHLMRFQNYHLGPSIRLTTLGNHQCVLGLPDQIEKNLLRTKVKLHWFSFAPLSNGFKTIIPNHLIQLNAALDNGLQRTNSFRLLKAEFYYSQYKKWKKTG